MRNIRISIITIVTLLISIGIVMIYSSSGVYALQVLGDSSYFLNRHLIFLCFGFVLTFCVMAIDYRDLRKWVKPLVLVSIVLLMLVLVPFIGHASFGARRWFNLGIVNFQPSEFVKIVLIIYIADYLARKKNRLNHFWDGFLPPVLILGLVSGLVILQPDLGNALLMASIVLIMLYVAGAQVYHLGLLAAMAVPLLIFLIVNEPYRMRRIIAFIDPWKDSQGVGFQLTQSQIAFGSGGLFGVGPGQSVQKLFYLPAAHTDFILSIIGEELGLLGALTVVMLFIAMIWQGARIAKRTQEPFGYYLSVGLVAMLSLQAVVNIGVSIGALPTKGLPLPFISYGGSALIFNMIAIGLLLNISRIQDL